MKQILTSRHLVSWDMKRKSKKSGEKLYLFTCINPPPPRHIVMYWKGDLNIEDVFNAVWSLGLSLINFG